MARRSRASPASCTSRSSRRAGSSTSRLIDLCQIVDTCALIAAIGLAVALAARLGEGRWLPAVLAVATAAVLALDPLVLLNSIDGMETALAAAFVSAIAVAAMADRPHALAIVACAATLVRPEAALFVVALPMLPWMRRARLLAACATFLVGCAAVRYAVFGELAPNTFYAKSGGTWKRFEIGVAYVVDCARDFPLALLAPLALVRAGSQRRPIAYVLAVAAVWLAFFLRSGGDLFAYSRLWLPLVPVLSACALAGVASALHRVPRAAIAAVVAVAALTAGRAAYVHDIPPQHATRGSCSGPRSGATCARTSPGSWSRPFRSARSATTRTTRCSISSG